MEKRKALVIGATGLIGRSLVFELLKSEAYEEVIVLTRKDLVIKHSKLSQFILDFDCLTDYASQMKVNDVFCCMGSTKARTPDENVYRKIDFEYPLQVARMAKEQGAQQFLLISSMGANTQSTVFYTRLKGEIEAAISSLNYPTYKIFRPSLLLGDRIESRPLETILQYFMRAFSILFIGPAKKYKAIPGNVVAKAMLKAAINSETGKYTYLNDKIFDLAQV
jgi:uncharacterized protein YbjT (DUF2867 family)